MNMEDTDKINWKLSSIKNFASIKNHFNQLEAENEEFNIKPVAKPIIELYLSNKELIKQTCDLKAIINELRRTQHNLQIELDKLKKENANESKMVQSIIDQYCQAFDLQHEIVEFNEKKYISRIIFIFNGKLYSNYSIDFTFDLNNNLLDFHINSVWFNDDDIRKWYSQHRNVLQLVCKLRSLVKDHVSLKNP